MKTWIVIFSICLAIVSNVKASHSLGSDMSYRCIGNNEYEITLNVYRDCNGSSLGNTSIINWSAACGSGSITVTRLAGYPIDVTPICATQTSSCSGGSSPIGIEQHTYRANITLPTGCSEVNFSWSLCCRNNAITTLNNPGSQSMYIESMVNNSIAPCNNSPVFLNPPVGFACEGFPVVFSDGGFDPDGDSLFFSLIDCEVSPSTSVVYGAGFSGSNPLTSTAQITIDSSTGAIEFTPIGAQNFIMCVLVEEYRNGVRIGKVVRDIQFSVLNCSNAPPTASGINGSTSYEITACTESFFCFEIEATDANVGDSITLTSNNGFIGSSFQTVVDSLTGAIKGQFCWKPSDNDIGSNPFTITVQDDACPIKSTNTYTYIINVIDNNNLGVNAGQDAQICSNQSTLLQASTSAPNVQAVWWTPATGLSTPNSLTTQAAPISTTTYTIHIQHPDGCISTDSVLVNVNPAPPSPLIPDSILVCEGENVILSTSTSASSYLWTNTHGFSSTAQNAILYDVGVLDSGSYSLSVIDASGCQSLEASLLLIVHPRPNTPAITPMAAICQGEDLVLNTVTLATSYVWTAPNGADTTTATNTITVPATSSLYQSGNWNLVVVDTNGCTSTASVPSTVNINNGVRATTFNNGPVCSGAAVQLNTTTVNSALYEWYSDAALTNLISTQQNPSINNITRDSTFFLVISVNGCASTPVATTVNLHPIPATPSVPADFAVCEGETITLTTTTAAVSYHWTGPNGFTSNLQNPAVIRPATTADAGIYTLSIMDANACQSADTNVIVSVNSAPVRPILTNNSAICEGDTLILTSTASADTFRWTSPNGIDTITTISSLIIVPTNTTYYQSGDWTLITQTGNNCPSQPSVASSVIINSSTATPNVFNSGPVCIGGDVILSTTSASGAFYEWYTDAALTNLVATTASFTATNITQDSTFYLVVSLSACTSPVGTTLVNVIGQPVAPTVPADFAVCEGDNIVLSTSTVAASYHWTGPNGFTSNLQNPTVITNASLVDSGAYRLVVTYSNGCVSADAIVQVSVNENPPVPNIVSNGPLCFGDTLMLSSSTNCGQSQWIGPNGNSQSTLGTLGGGNVLWTVGSSTSIPVNNANYLPGNWSMICIDTLTACRTESNTINVIINNNPTQPAIFNNGPLCNGATANLTTAMVAGASYAWFSDAALTNLVSTAQNPSIVNITTDTTWYLLVTVNGCRSSVGSTTVRVRSSPARPNVLANLFVCEGDALVLTTTTNAAGYHWSGPNGFNSNLQSPTAISVASVVDSGTYTLSIVDANGCRSEDTSVQVIVNPRPASPLIVSNNTPICEGDDIILSANVGVVGTTYEWFNASNVLVGTGQTLTIVGASLVNAGNYYVITSLNTCSSVASNVTTATVDLIPSTVAFAGNDIGLCNTFTTNLDARPPSSATGFWTTNSTATIANPNLANTVVYNLPTGTSTFYWTLSNGACTDFSVDSMVLDVTPASADVANAGLDQNLCGQTSATLAATTLTTAQGQWTQSAGQAGQGVVITNPTNPNTTVTGLQQGNNYLFTWTLSNGNCIDYSTDMVQVNVDVAPPDNAYAGVNILLCNQNTTNLNAFVSQYGTGVWTSTSSATIIDPTLANTTVINLPQDTNVFVWTLSNGTCQDYATDTVFVVVSTTTDVAEAGNNQVVCSVNALTLGATMPSAGIGTWSQTAAQAAQGVVIVNANDPNTQVVGLNVGTTYAFTWTLSNGTCQDYSSDVTTITINTTSPDNAFAGNDINLCGTTTTNLNAAVPTVATGFWTSSSSATISNPTQASSTVSGLGLGQNIFVWTLSNGTCQDYDNDTIIITVTTPSSDVANAGLDSAYCAQSAVVLNAAAPSVGGGYWSQTPSQASLGAVINNPTDTSSTVSNLVSGVTYTFTWTLTNGACVDYASDQVLIKIDVLPSNVAYAGEDTILCGGNSVPLDAFTPPIGTGFWTTNDIATIVTPVDPSSLVVNIGEDTTTYYWTLSNGACVDYSVDSTTVIISAASTDLAFAGFDQVLCGVDSILLSGANPTTSTGIWTQSAGQLSQGVIIADPNDPNTLVTGIQTGQVYTFTWTLSTSGCANFSTDEVQYTINALPTEVAYAGPDIVLCGGNTTIMDATNPIFSTGSWSSNSSAIIVNPTLRNSTIVNIPTDTVAFYWALSNGSCTDYSIDTMLIIVTPTFSVDTANAGLDINLCNEDTAQLMALAPNLATGRWTQPLNQSSAGVVIANPNAATTSATGLQLDSTYTFTWSVSNGPCADYDSDKIIVRVNTLPTDAAYAGEDFVICGIDTAIVKATTPSLGRGLWTTTSTATIVTPPNTRTELLNLSLGTNEFIWTLSNGACRDYSRDTIVITMDAAPVANADSFVVVYNSNGNTIDVTPNDNLNNNWVIGISESIASGTLTNLGTGVFDLLLQDVLVDQRFIYELCNPNCPVIYCDTAVVIINVQGGTECDFPNMITPNNDDANETFIVPCLDGLDGTKFVVYNRWGDSIYENDNYKNDWGGTHNGVPVPDATYFYIMELADGQRFQGFVEVRR